MICYILKKLSLRFFGYFDYVDILFLKTTAKLSEHTEISDHSIDLEKGKYLFYGPIYSLRLLELEILKIYTKTNLKNILIWPSKFFVYAPIFFVHKPDNSFSLCINYRELNNRIIKKRYLFFFMKKLLDCFGKTKCFI